MTLFESVFHNVLGELLIEVIFVLLLLAQDTFDFLKIVLHKI